MKKIIITGCLFIFGSISNIQSQAILNESKIFLKSDYSHSREAIPIFNAQNKLVQLVLMDFQRLKVLRFYDELAVEKIMLFERPPNKYQNVLGYNTENNLTNIYFSSGQNKIFYVLSFDTEKGSLNSKPLELKLKKEKFLSGFRNGSNFYVLTRIKNASKLKIYCINVAGEIKTSEFDFSKYRFSDNDPYTLNSFLTKTESSVINIDNKSPNPLDVTAQDKKGYVIDNSYYLSLDNQEDRTNIITINLEELTSKLQVFLHSKISRGVVYKTNSYIYDKKLFQITLSTNQMHITIRDLFTSKIIKEYVANRENEISFKNSELRQEVEKKLPAKNKNKDLKRNSGFFRKVFNSNIGVSVYESDLIHITFGGYKEFTRSTVGNGFGMMPEGSLSTPMGSVTTPSRFNYNPTMFGYNSYSASRSVYFTGLFEKESFEHLDGELLDNAFTKIKNFSNEIKKDISSETIFKLDNYYVFGYYYKKLKKYYLRKFEDDK